MLTQLEPDQFLGLMLILILGYEHFRFWYIGRYLLFAIIKSLMPKIGHWGKIQKWKIKVLISEDNRPICLWGQHGPTNQLTVPTTKSKINNLGLSGFNWTGTCIYCKSQISLYTFTENIKTDFYFWFMSVVELGLKKKAVRGEKIIYFDVLCTESQATTFDS